MRGSKQCMGKQTNPEVGTAPAFGSGLDYNAGVACTSAAAFGSGLDYNAGVASAPTSPATGSDRLVV